MKGIESDAHTKALWYEGELHESHRADSVSTACLVGREEGRLQARETEKNQRDRERKRACQSKRRRLRGRAFRCL